MAMNSPIKPYLLCTTTLPIIIIITLLHLFSLSSCFNHHQPSSPSLPLGALGQDKTRLGSTPPSCHNKCNQCNPCMAVQVPTLPNHDSPRPAHRTSRALPMDFAGIGNNRYSNYKPLAWKCRCGDRFYNP